MTNIHLATIPQLPATGPAPSHPQIPTGYVLVQESQLRQLMQLAGVSPKIQEASPPVVDGFPNLPEVEEAGSPVARVASPRVAPTNAPKRPRASPNALSEREEFILANCVFNSNMSLAQIGNKYGITRERARQIRNRAVEKWNKLNAESPIVIPGAVSPSIPAVELGLNSEPAAEAADPDYEHVAPPRNRYIPNLDHDAEPAEVAANEIDTPVSE